MTGRSIPDEANKYRFGFNGKENDDNKEWGQSLVQDYGFRLYNPAIAKFLSVDPLADKFPYYTPYQFAGNKPVVAIDLDGLEEITIHSIYYRDLIKDVDFSKMTSQEILDLVSSFNCHPDTGDKYGGFKNRESQEHAMKFYETDGQAVSIQSLSGPLIIHTYSRKKGGKKAIKAHLVLESDIKVSQDESSFSGIKKWFTETMEAIIGEERKTIGSGFVLLGIDELPGEDVSGDLVSTEDYTIIDGLVTVGAGAGNLFRGGKSQLLSEAFQLLDYANGVGQNSTVVQSIDYEASTRELRALIKSTFNPDTLHCPAGCKIPMTPGYEKVLEKETHHLGHSEGFDTIPANK